MYPPTILLLAVYAALASATPTAAVLAAPVRPPKGGASLTSLDVELDGSGCRPGTVSVMLASDNSALTIIFDNFAAADGPKAGGASTRAFCRVNIGVASPGWAFDVASADFRGYVYIEKGVEASLGNIHKIVKGPFEDDFLLHKDGEISDTEAAVCQKKDARIQISLSATVDSGTSKANGGQQEEGNNMDYDRKRNATTNSGDSNVEAHTTRRESQRTPSSALVDPLSAMEDTQSLRTERPALSEATPLFNDPDMLPQDIPAPAPSTTAMASLSPVETPTGTIQTYNNTTDEKSTVHSVAISSRTTGAEAGSKLDTEALPGVNQDDPKFAMAPQVTPFAPMQTLPASSVASANTVYKPMPGKNQPDVAVPSLDLLGISGPIPPAPSSPPVLTTTMTTYVTLAKTLPGVPSVSTDATLSSAFSGSTSAASSLSSSTLSVSSFTAPSISSLPPLPSISSFVLLTRSEQDKEQEKTSSFSILTPQAITASSSLLSATVLPTIMASPSSLSSTFTDETDGGLTPLSRSLFILFGVLGAITVLIAVAIFFVSRRNKRRAREAEAAEQDQIHSKTIEEFKESYNYGNTTPVSRKSSLDNPSYLTDSERNIIKRAATADGQPEVSLIPAFSAI
ncbi:secreted protein [Stemphylium lycopersici]|nr:secreted protein [Stemphylium lycopersici]RAR05780.1 secreted protein [Stemphylium lycopersici]